jgi:threonine dehydrogenase-like Zn-dependent dehydrogenase
MLTGTRPLRDARGRYKLTAMKALQKTRPAFGLALREIGAPDSPGPGEVLVAVGATGVCGTDVHIYEWTPGYEAMTKAMPVTLGHEFAGTVAAVGPGVEGIAAGALVAVRPSIVCGRCAACAAGDADSCTNRVGLGVTRNGGLQPFVLAPAENCVAVPDPLDVEVAALTEPMTVCAEAVDTGGVRAGDRVLVLGPGNVGQGVALFARAAGAAEVVIVGKHDAPRLECLRRMGFDDTVDVGDAALQDALAPYLAQGRFDVVIEATGVPAIVQHGLNVLRKRGVLVVVGIHPGPVGIDLTRLVRDHQQIRGSYRAPAGTWPRVVRFLAENAALARQMVSHRLPLERAIEGLELSRSKAASKVVIVQ